jgi:hypothetical protein
MACLAFYRAFDIIDTSEPADCTKESFRSAGNGVNRDWSISLTSP